MGGIAAAALLLLIIFMAVMGVSASLPSSEPVPTGYGKVSALGSLLFTKYIYAFEVVSVLLLLAVIGAVALIRKQDPVDTHAD
jgi:NADH-quinone oxidoreductase subunit J